MGSFLVGPQGPAVDQVDHLADHDQEPDEQFVEALLPVLVPELLRMLGQILPKGVPDLLDRVVAPSQLPDHELGLFLFQ